MSENFNIDDISNLASIELSEEEKAKLQKDLQIILEHVDALKNICLLYTSPSPRDSRVSRMPSSA